MTDKHDPATWQGDVAKSVALTKRPITPGEFFIIAGNQQPSGPVMSVNGKYVHTNIMRPVHVDMIMAHGPLADCKTLLKTLHVLSIARHNARETIERDYQAAKRAAIEASGLT